MWYFGAHPAALARTPHGTRFSVAYLSPTRAYVVLFTVVPGNPDRANDSGFVPPEYEETQRRDLTPEERGYFEGLVV